jgi:DNA-binding NarL/FixJ family response regulator
MHRVANLAHTMTTELPVIRILAVDDHPLLREGIAALIATEADLRLVGVCSNGRDAIQQFRALRPDVTLIDLQMPEMSGLDVITRIRGEFPAARIIVLTMYGGDAQVVRAFKAGAAAYLMKNLAHKELLETIRSVHAGRKAVSPEVSIDLATHATDDPLTPAEIEVLRLITAGNSNKQIADRLGITEDTVKGRVRSILSKLGANDRTHAATIGLKRGIIHLS